MKLGSHLFLLLLAALLPLLLFAVVMTYLFHREQTSQQEQSLVRAAHALSLDIDRELTASIHALEMLATSEHLAVGDLRKFHELALSTVKAQGAWEAIVLVAPNGQQVANTRVPFNANLPPTDAPELIDSVVQSRQPAVSNLFAESLAKTPLIAIAVPVTRSSQLKYVLAANVTPKFLVKVLADQKAPADIRTVVIDRRNLTLARVHGIDKYLGKPAGATLAAKSRESESGFFHGTTLEGLALASAFHRSKLSGWTVAVALPLTLLHAPLNRSLVITLGGGLGLLTLGLLLANIVARRITTPITALVSATDAVGRGDTPAVDQGAVAELDALASALANAAGKRNQAEQKLREVTEFSRQAIEAIPGGTFAVDRELRFTLWSKQQEKRTGLSASVVLGHHIREIYLNDTDEVLERNREALSGHTVTVPDKEITLPASGETQWNSITLSPLRDSTGAIIGVLGMVIDITERKNHEAALATAALIQATLDALTSHIAILDGEGVILATNRAWQRFAETNAQDPNAVGPGANYLKVCESGKADENPVTSNFAAGMLSVLRGDRQQFELEYPCDSPSQKRWFIGRAIRFHDNGAIRVVVTHTDITERKLAGDALKEAQRELEQRVAQRTAELARANAELVENEQRFRAIFDQAAVGVAQMDSKSGSLQGVNHKYCQILGYTRDQLLGLDFMGLTHPDDLASDLAAMEELKSGRVREFSLEKRLIRKDGNPVWVNLTVSPLWPSGMAPTSHIAVIEDITERRLAEQKLASAESRFRALTERSGDAIALLDRNGIVTYISPSAVHITGRGPEDRVGLPADAFRHPDDVLVSQQAIAALLADPAIPRTIEVRTRHKDGSWRWIEAVLTNMLDDPNVNAIVINFRNISKRKQADEHIRRGIEELQQLHEIARSMLESGDLHKMAEIILAKAVALSGCDLGVIRLLETASERISIIASHGYRDVINLRRHENIPTEGGQSNELSLRRRHRLRAFQASQTEIIGQVDTGERMQTFKREGIVSLINIPVAAQDDLLGVLQLGNRSPRDFEPRLVRILETLAHDFGIAVQKSKLLKETFAAQEQLRQLSRRLVETQENERRYIARELHDEIGALLTALKIMLKLDSSPGTAGSLKIVDEAIAKTRAIAQHLRPPMLDHLGLQPTVEWYAKEFTARTGIAVEIKPDGIDRRFDSEIEIALFRIFQEALTNVARHSKASSVVVQVTATDTKLNMAMLDNGIGFDSKKTFQDASSSGISGMRERVRALAGRIEISRDELGGTAVDVEVPLPASVVFATPFTTETTP